MSILVTTPTGHIGSRVVERLLDANADVAVFARNPDKLPERVRTRLRVHQGTLEDGAALERAARGADAVFYVIPPNYGVEDWRGWQRELGRTAAAALKGAGVRRVVLLSSSGAQRDDLTAISGLGEVERILEGAIENVAHLRAGSFMENFLNSIPTIAEQGAIYGAFPADMPLPMVATRDIGDVAARWLRDAAWTGRNVVGVHGPADVTHAEAARVVGDAVGRPVRYVAVPPEAVRDSLLQMGASRSVAEGYAGMLGGIVKVGPAYNAEPRTRETTTPTTMAEFARAVLRPALEKAAGAAR